MNIFGYDTAALIAGILTGVFLIASIIIVITIIWAVKNHRNVMELISKMPSTNLRIAVTLFLVLLTGGNYLARGVPGNNEGAWDSWLIFMAAMSGIDVLQFASKRLTTKVEPGVTQETTTTRETKVVTAPAAEGDR